MGKRIHTMNKALAGYIDHINLRRAMLGRPTLDVFDDYAEIQEELNILGSPEVLAGDGEYSSEEVRRRTEEWNDASTELYWMGFSL